VVDETDGLDSGDGFEITLEAGVQVEARIAASRSYGEGEELAGVEAGVDGAETGEAADHEAGSG